MVGDAAQAGIVGGGGTDALLGATTLAALVSTRTADGGDGGDGGCKCLCHAFGEYERTLEAYMVEKKWRYGTLGALLHVTGLIWSQVARVWPPLLFAALFALIARMMLASPLHFTQYAG